MKTYEAPQDKINEQLDLRGSIQKALELVQPTGIENGYGEDPSQLRLTPEAEVLLISLARRIEQLEAEWS